MDEFDAFYRRKLNIPQTEEMTSYEFDSNVQEVSGTKIQGGVIKSQNGKLTLDLDNGKLIYNNGVEQLFSLADDSLTINDANGNALLNS